MKAFIVLVGEIVVSVATCSTDAHLVSKQLHGSRHLHPQPNGPQLGPKLRLHDQDGGDPRLPAHTPQIAAQVRDTGEALRDGAVAAAGRLPCAGGEGGTWAGRSGQLAVPPRRP